MKTLGLLRHAKSCEVDREKVDFVRGLNNRGRRAARRMGAWFAEHGLAFDQVLASPAERVRETLREVEAGYGKPLPVAEVDDLYLASAEELLFLAEEQPGAVGRLLLVGHNPGIQQLVLQRAQPENASPLAPSPLAEMREKFPTAAYAELSFDVMGWGEIGQSKGKLTCFVAPATLDPSLGPETSGEAPEEPAAEP